MEPFNDLQRLYHWGVMEALKTVGEEAMYTLDEPDYEGKFENWETVDFALYFIRELPAVPGKSIGSDPVTLEEWRRKIKDVGLEYVKDRMDDSQFQKHYDSDENVLEDHFNDYFDRAVLDILHKHGPNKPLDYLSA